MKKFYRILPYLKKRCFFYVGGFFVLIFVNCLQLIIPKVVQKTIDGILTGVFTQRNIFYASLIILGLSVLILVCRFFWRILIFGNGWYLEKSLRQDYYNHLLTLSQSYFDKAKIGNLMAYATNDLNAVRMLFGAGFVALNDMIVMMIASFIFMLNINVKLTLVSIIPLPVLSLIIMYFGKKTHYRFKKVQDSFSLMSGQIQESITGIRVVKAFGQEEYEGEKVAESASEYVKQNLKMAVIQGAFDPLIDLIISISILAVLFYGGTQTMIGEISAGEFISFYSYLGMLVWPMIAIGWFTNLYQRGTASIKRLNEIFSIEPEIIDENTDDNIKYLKGIIEIKNLSFYYSKELGLVFDNISTSVDLGETLAIVGKTGCGKSTLIDLMTRIYKSPKHTIFIDNYPLEKIPLKILRKNIMIVPQEIFLFSDTITNNIKLIDQNANFEQVKNVSKIAQVYNDIISFKDGFETVVGERGVTLSGGQKQRIAIARALLSNAPILILDDSLSAVDVKTEKIILQHLIEERKGKTTIIIAHRISSIEHADKIIVLESGKIIESGSHHKLLKENGLYAELYDKQQLEEKIKEA